MTRSTFLSVTRTLLLSISLICGLTANATDLEKYLLYSNKAENSIVESNYAQAQRYYDSCMQVWNRPFAVDLSNALKVANLNGDHKLVRVYAEKLIALGCPLSFFDHPDHLRSFRATTHWNNLINNYPKIRKQYLKNNDWALRTTIEYLRAKDQCLRESDPHYTFLKDSIYKLDDTIKTAINGLFERKFPNEYDYGVFLEDDTTLFYNEPLEYILLHNYSKLDTVNNPNANTRSIDLTNVLLDAVRKGDMHPEEFALLNDRSGAYQSGRGYGQMNMISQIDGKLYFEKEGDSVRTERENNRAKIGLDNRDHARKKLIYNVTNNVHGFILRRSTFGITKLPGGVFSEAKMNRLFTYSGVDVE